MKIAITGGSGHIGANLIRLLIDQGHQIKALVHRSSKAFAGLDIDLIEGDINRPESLDELCRGTELIFHLAAQISIGQYPVKKLLEVNVEGTEKVIKASRRAGIKRMVHFSSIHALNQFPLDQPLTEKNGLNIHSRIPYERTKALSEKMARESASRNGLEVVIVNPTAVIGPFDFRPSFLGQFLIRLERGRIPGLVAGGYDWVDARDVAQGALMAATEGESGESYLLSGHWAELPDLMLEISRVLDREISLPKLPGWIARLGVPFLGIWARMQGQDPLYTSESLEILRTSNKKVSHEKATGQFSYHPRPLRETLKDSYDWYQNNGYL